MTVYEKGAEVVRLYETLLGKAGFRKGVRVNRLAVSLVQTCSRGQAVAPLSALSSS